MFCGECGHKWAPDEIASARFCAECGAPREDVPPTVPSQIFTPTPTIPVPHPTPTPPLGGGGGHLYGSPLMKPSLPVGGSSLDLPHPTALSPRSASAVCAQCAAPFGDSTALFCGECGHPRPPPVAVVDDDDGDLFGTGSSSSSAPPPPTSVPPFSSSAPAPPPAPAFSSFAAPPSVSVPFNPPTAAALPAYPPPQAPQAPQPPQADPADPAASVTFNVSPALTQLSSLLNNLSVSRTDAAATRAEPDGTGAGVSVRHVTKARAMDALSTRLEISAAVEQNRTAPQEQMDGYHVTRVHDALTVVHNARVATTESEEDAFYDARSVRDDGTWLDLLRRHRASGTKFTDPQFPPDATSLFRDPQHKKLPHLEEFVYKWKRLSEFFNETAYVEVTMLDDAQRLVCAIAMKTSAEAESILGILQQEPQVLDPAFLEIAKQIVVTGLTRKRRDHLLLCTKNMITYLSEYVQDGLQRLDLLWDKSLLERYKPLAFAGVGDGAAGYRVDASDAGMVSRVSVLVPVHFTAQGTCVFDRSREAPDQVSGVGIAPGDLRLGRLADAYLFGAMSILSTSPTALAQAFPLLEPDLVRPDRVDVHALVPTEQQYNDEGVYAVRFWRGNRSRVVVVDDFVPCSQYGKPVFASFTGANGKFEIWSLLIEKAYAKLHGGYEAIVGGQEAYALQDLFGGVPVTYKLQETCPTEDAAWQTLHKTLASGSLVGCVNDSVDMELPRGLQKSAAYGILSLVELEYRGESVRLVQLRNSWGIGSVHQPDKWAGAWSSADPKWHALSRAQKIECGFQFREDATYWMDFAAFYCFYSSIVESRNLYNFKSIPDGLGNPVAPTLSVHVITSEWNGITCGGREAMHLNPQYHLFSPAAQGCALTVHLEQPSRRLRNASEYGAYIAPVVFRHGTKSQRKIDLGAGDVVATGTFISNRSCVLDTTLEHSTDAARPFVVIPATYDGNLPGALGFSMTLFTSMPTAVVPVSDSSSLPICCVCQRALSGAFRTFTLATASGGNEPAQVDRVCNDCVGAYRDRNTPVCQHCQERIEAVEGRFSGRLFTLPDGVSVHAECVDAYRIRLADKCVHCGQAIAAIPGRFDGRFFELPGGDKCHAECMDAHQLATAKRCMHCTEPVAKIPGRFDGRFYKLATDDELVHFECWDAYQASIAPKCVHCAQAIVVVPGRFDGRFYELTSGLGKVHFECWDTYQAAVMKG